MYLQDWRSQIFFFFTAPLGIMFYFFMVHYMSMELIPPFQFAARTVLPCDGKLWSETKRSLYNRVKVVLYSLLVTILIILLLAVSVTSYSKGYQVGLYIVLDTALTIGNNQYIPQLLSSYPELTATITTFCYLLILVFVYTSLYIALCNFWDQNWSEAITIIFKGNGGDYLPLQDSGVSEDESDDFIKDMTSHPPLSAFRPIIVTSKQVQGEVLPKELNSIDGFMFPDATRILSQSISPRSTPKTLLNLSKNSEPPVFSSPEEQRHLSQSSPKTVKNQDQYQPHSLDDTTPSEPCSEPSMSDLESTLTRSTQEKLEPQLRSPNPVYLLQSESEVPCNRPPSEVPCDEVTDFDSDSSSDEHDSDSPTPVFTGKPSQSIPLAATESLDPIKTKRSDSLPGIFLPEQKGCVNSTPAIKLTLPTPTTPKVLKPSLTFPLYGKDVPDSNNLPKLEDTIVESDESEISEPETPVPSVNNKESNPRKLEPLTIESIMNDLDGFSPTSASPRGPLFRQNNLDRESPGLPTSSDTARDPNDYLNGVVAITDSDSSAKSSYSHISISELADLDID